MNGGTDRGASGLISEFAAKSAGLENTVNALQTVTRIYVTTGTPPYNRNGLRGGLSLNIFFYILKVSVHRIHHTS